MMKSLTLKPALTIRSGVIGFLFCGLITSLLAQQGHDNRIETRQTSEAKPYQLPEAILRETRPIFDGKTLDGWIQIPTNSWEVKDGVMASKGAGRGVLYTAQDYTKFRLFFTVRQVKANHHPGVLVFGTRPAAGAKGLDSLGAIQLQPPDGWHWDYRPGKNKEGDGFTKHPHPKFENYDWLQVEMLVDASTGTARMAVAQPVGSKAVEVLSYHLPEAGKTAPIAWQLHNTGLLDEYKDIRVEVDPKEFDFITTK